MTRDMGGDLVYIRKKEKCCSGKKKGSRKDKRFSQADRVNELRYL